MNPFRRLAGRMPFAALVLFACTLSLASASAQTRALKVIQVFDGTNGTPQLPQGTLVIDSSGNLYGTDTIGGTQGAGSVFEMVNSAGNYTLQTLYSFPSQPDGSNPQWGLLRDSSGNLFGVTPDGGSLGMGTVFELQYNGGNYTYNLLYAFTGASDGGYPVGELAMDSSGNLYGVTNLEASGIGGAAYGTVFELVPQGGGAYAFKTIYSFSGGADGGNPDAGVIVDSSGNLFGTTGSGSRRSQVGSVYELTPASGGTFNFTTLYNFTGGPDGAYPNAALRMDRYGNLYGTTSGEWGSTAGSVFELVNSNGTYTENTLYSFTGPYNGDGAYPSSPVVVDAAGNIYGTTESGGNTGVNPNGSGTVFELVNSNGAYTEQILWSFTGKVPDEGFIHAGLAMDPNGNLFGVSGNGSLWEIANVSTTTALQLSSSANPAQPNQSVTFTANVSSSPSTTLTGNVIFWDGTTVIGTVPLVNGAASLTVSPAALGNGVISIAAQFVSNSPTVGASFSSLQETAGLSPTAVQLSSSINPASSGQSVIFSTYTYNTQTGNTVDGTVNFLEGSTLLGSVASSGGFAALTIDATVLGVGADSVTAQFTPNDPTQASNSAAMTEVVTAEAGVAVTNGSNIFTGPQTVNGTITANSFNGSLNCAGCIGNTQLGINYASGDAQGGNALNALNAQALNGMSSAAFAVIGPGGNTFAGPQIVNGSITANGVLSGTSASFSGLLASSGLALAPAGSATPAQGFSSSPFDLPASLYNSSSNAAQNLLFRWQAEPAANTNNTASPAATLNLLYGASGAPTETGLSVNANGTLNFAPGQIFPGTLSGGGNPTFGTVTATSFSGGSFSGNGAGLNGVQAAALAPTAMVNGSQVEGPVSNALNAFHFSGTISESQVGNLAADLSNAVTTSESFATNAANNAQAAAQTFATGAANTAQANAISTSETFAGTAATNAQNAAEAFASSAASKAQDAAETFATNAANTAQTNAQNFATSAANAAQTAAQTFATTASGNAQTAAQNFATNAANTAQTNAQTFATNAANTAQTNAETFATNTAANAQAGALTAAETYANSTFVPLAGGTMTGALNLPALNAAGSVTSASVTASGAVQGASVTASGNLAGGSLTIGGGTPITQYISIKQNITLPVLKPGACTTVETAALTGFTPGDTDSIALGIPSDLLAGLNGGHGPAVVLNYQAWETNSSPSTTITLQICNVGGGYKGGASGNVRIDIFKH